MLRGHATKLITLACCIALVCSVAACSRGSGGTEGSSSTVGNTSLPTTDILIIPQSNGVLIGIPLSLIGSVNVATATIDIVVNGTVARNALSLTGDFTLNAGSEVYEYLLTDNGQGGPTKKGDLIIVIITLSDGSEVRGEREIGTNSTEAVQSMQYVAQQVFSEDYDADGIIDAVTHVEFDPYGNETRYAVRADVGQDLWLGTDGIYLVTTTRHYDDNGNLVEIIWDNNGDDLADRRESYRYDEQGRKIEYISDWNADGVPDILRNFSYDNQGNLIQESEADLPNVLSSVLDFILPAVTVEDDTNDENQTNLVPPQPLNDESERVVYTYDDQGNVTSRTVYWAHGGRVEYWSYDNQGRMTEHINNFYGSCHGYARKIWTYNDAGLKATESCDLGNDGRIDSIVHREYTADGKLRRNRLDTDADGQIDSIYNATYDGLGRLIRSATDSNADGKDDSARIIRYSPDGTRQAIMDDENADGLPERIWHYEYDAQGNTIGYSYDDGADGQLDYITRSELTYKSEPIDPKRTIKKPELMPRS